MLWEPARPFDGSCDGRLDSGGKLLYRLGAGARGSAGAIGPAIEAGDMLFDEAVFIGIDATAGDRPLPFAALDSDLRLVAQDCADLEDVLAFAAGQSAAVAAVDAPQGPPTGLLQRSDVRRGLGLPPDGSTWSGWRVCEFGLRRRGIRVANTPSMMALAPGWVQRGQQLHKRIKGLGFRTFVAGEPASERMLLELHPNAAFTALLERQPLPKNTLEGRLQRQLLLFLKGVDIPNPMRALEEITRHHILTGHLPLDDLLEPGELDALMGAYTAYLAALYPEQICQEGDSAEGLITLPVSELQAAYT
jgi:predicted nuclease with RNAse H fold